MKQFVESHGFHFYHLRLAGDLPDGESPSLLERLIPMIEWGRRMRMKTREVNKSLIDGSAHRSLVQTLAPDLVVIEWPLGYYALPFLAWKIPVVMISPTWPSDYGDGAPLTHSHLVPTSSRLNRYRCHLEWARFRAGFGALRMLYASLVENEFKNYRSVAERYGLSFPDLIDNERYAGLMARLRLPEICLCPSAFDLPRKPRPNRYFLDSGLGLEPPEEPDGDKLPWRRLKADTTTVYCAFGTRVPEHGPCKALARKALKTIIEAFSAQSRFQLVLCVGANFDLTPFASAPDNIVIIKEWVSQIKLLRRAAVHITHGGFSSVRESIECQVPMIVIPFDSDQPGNAARVVYHGLGVRVFPRKVVGAKIVELVKQIEASPTYKENLRRMKLEFDRQRARQSAADLIESLLPTK